MKEALEHAYPNSVTEEDLAISLRCTLDEVKTFLAILEKESQIESVQAGEWIRKAYSEWALILKLLKFIASCASASCSGQKSANSGHHHLFVPRKAKHRHCNREWNH